MSKSLRKLSRLRRSIAFLVGVFILYSIVVSFLPLADRLLLFPSRHRIDPGGAERVAVPFRSGELEVWKAASPLAEVKGEAQLFVLRFYGNADRAERWVAEEADAFGERALEVWGVNYPGFGGSSGAASLASIGPAAEAAFDALKARAGEKPIFVFADSMGTAAGLHLAAQRPVAGLILHNPPPLRQIILQQHGWWNLWLLAVPVSLQVPRDLDSIANAKRAEAPALFLLAGMDEVVLPKFQRLVVDAYGGEKRVIQRPTAGHNSPMETTELAEYHHALDWLWAKWK